MANPNRRIKLTRTAQVANLSMPSFTYTVTSSDGNLMENDIFVFRKIVTNNLTNETQDFFDRVASIVDLSNVPIGAPNEGEEEFRGSSFTISFDNQSLGDEVWSAIQSGARDLKRALDASENLGAAEEVWVGIEP